MGRDRISIDQLNARVEWRALFSRIVNEVGIETGALVEKVNATKGIKERVSYSQVSQWRRLPELAATSPATLKVPPRAVIPPLLRALAQLNAWKGWSEEDKVRALRSLQSLLEPGVVRKQSSDEAGILQVQSRTEIAAASDHFERWRPNKDKLTELLQGVSQKAIWSNMQWNRSKWDRFRRGEASLTTTEAQRLGTLLGAPDLLRDWCVGVSRGATAAGWRPFMDRGTIHDLGEVLRSHISKSGPPLTLYVALTDAKWLSDFFESIPKADLDGNRRLLRTRIERVVVRFLEPGVAEFLEKHGLLALRLQEANSQVDLIGGYSRVVGELPAFAKPGVSVPSNPIWIEQRAWHGLPPVWGVLAEDVMVVGEWDVNDAGVLAPMREGKLLFRDGAGANEFSRYSALLTGRTDPAVESLPYEALAERRQL